MIPSNLGIYSGAGSWLTATFLIRCPQRQVVTEQLHDEGGILVRVLCHIIELGNCILERGACHLASFVWVVQHLVLEDREVQREAKADGMSHSQVLLCYLLCLLICLFCTVRRLGFLVVGCVLGNVAIVIGLHLLVEDLRLPGACLGDETAIQERQDRVTNFVELSFHFGAILLRKLSVVFVTLPM